MHLISHTLCEEHSVVSQRRLPMLLLIVKHSSTNLGILIRKSIFPSILMLSKDRPLVCFKHAFVIMHIKSYLLRLLNIFLAKLFIPLVHVEQVKGFALMHQTLDMLQPFFLCSQQSFVNVALVYQSHANSCSLLCVFTLIIMFINSHSFLGFIRYLSWRFT